MSPQVHYDLAAAEAKMRQDFVDAEAEAARQGIPDDHLASQRHYHEAIIAFHLATMRARNAGDDYLLIAGGAAVALGSMLGSLLASHPPALHPFIADTFNLTLEQATGAPTAGARAVVTEGRHAPLPGGHA